MLGLFVFVIPWMASKANDLASARTKQGLLALYNFCEPGGPVVRDISGQGEPVNLHILNPSAVRRKQGNLIVQRATEIRTKRAPTRLLKAFKKSQAITIEAWVTPARVNQSGPARIVTYSRNGSERHFTLGQDGNRYDVRFRTQQTNKNGIPSLRTPSGEVNLDPTHLVYTRNAAGQARLYIDGHLSNEKQVKGDLGPWRDTYQLAIANEIGGQRIWLGSYHLVALYDRALSPEAINTHFAAGPDAANADLDPLAGAQRSKQALYFETKVAPLLANHCLECHDSASQKGKLDLSKKVAALKGGREGKAIYPGQAEKSELYLTVLHDEMPDDRPPLTDEEKAILQKWINEGATWSLDEIDPALYTHGGEADVNWVRRLTLSEYIRTVQASVGVDITTEARALFPKDLRADGFSNTAYNLNVDFEHVGAYSQLAAIIVERMDISAFTKRFKKGLTFTDNDMGALINNMSKWLLRGELDDYELFAYRGITTSVAAAGGTLDEAVGLVIEAMLQSPRFIYRVERQVGDGQLWPVDDYELATRMSYALWGAPPDQALLETVEKSGLYDDAIVEAEARRLLKDPKARSRSLEFMSEWFNLERLTSLSPSQSMYPDWDPRLADDMRLETLMLFEHLVWHQKAPLKTLFNSRTTFVTPRLAQHYQLPDSLVRKTLDADSFYEVALPDESGRAGILTHGSTLTIGGDEASMVTRGLFVMHEVLRGIVKDPPPCVDTTPVPTQAGLTQRRIAMDRIGNKACGGCHSRFEPLAFGLEKFDGLGAYHRTDEHGNTLREDGEILIPGKSKAMPFDRTIEFVDALAKSERVKETITWKATQFALGRPLTAVDAPFLDRIHSETQKRGGTYQDLMTAIVLSDLVRFTQTEPVQ